MKHLIAITTAALIAATPMTAQTNDTPTEDGFDLMEEGAKLLLRGLLDEMEPAIDELRNLTKDLGPAMQMLADEMGPALVDLLERVDDFRHYEAPEILPNGDIIIRRRPDAPAYNSGDGGEIEL